jgi:hypothetical protein
VSEDPEVTRQLAQLEALKRQGDVHGVMEVLGEVLKTVSRTFRPTDLAHSLQSLRGTVGALKGDTDRCQARFEEAFEAWRAKTKDQAAHGLLHFEVRQLIRTFFAEVDGTVYSARQVILWAHERSEVDLSIPEIALLREESYRFDQKTKTAQARSAFNSTLDSFLLTFTILPRLFKAESSLDLSEYGWQAFRELLEIRNAVTHPKEIINLVVDAKVITRILPAARSWYYASLLAAVKDPLLPGVIHGAV